ncbi:hypothetical protein GN956_G2695 [Arapaima gigas]
MDLEDNEDEREDLGQERQRQPQQIDHDRLAPPSTFNASNKAARFHVPRLTCASGGFVLPVTLFFSSPIGSAVRPGCFPSSP